MTISVLLVRRPIREPNDGVTRHGLLLRAQPGDPDAWNDSEMLYSPLIAGWLRYQSVPRDVLDDLGQEVLLGVVRSLGSFSRQRGLNGLVALKMVLAGEFTSETRSLRFQAEAELAARVRHPNIVQVYESGARHRRASRRRLDVRFVSS